MNGQWEEYCVHPTSVCTDCILIAGLGGRHHMHQSLLDGDASLCHVDRMSISVLWDRDPVCRDAVSFFSQLDGWTLSPCCVCGSDPAFSLSVWDQVSVSIQDLWDGS